MNRHELLRELRLLLPDGRLAGGAKAVLAVADLIWWARPLTWLSQLPGVMAALDFAYRWVAAHRNCKSPEGACEVSR
jgi:predicted DCC family thiol-disulfide oxidoreductase YuxK